MKLIALIECLDDRYGGPANSLPSLLNELAKKPNVTVTALSLRNYQDESNSYLDQKQITWDNEATYKGISKIKFSPELRAKLESIVDSDTVVYINNLWNYVSYIGFTIARRKGAKVIFSPRGSLYDWSLRQRAIPKKIALALFQLRHLRNADLIHVTCESEFETVKNLGVPEKKIFICPHGIPVPWNATKNQKIRKYHDNDTTRYILFMSRLHKVKGLDVLIDIWSRISHRFPDCKLVVAGPDYGGFLPKLRKTPNLEYVGTVSGSEKDALLRGADFLVLPSYSENFGVVIGEALAHGTPVLTTTNTPWEIINEAYCGRCVPLDVFEEELLNFLSLPSASLAVMRSNAPTLIDTNYNWPKLADVFMKKALSLK